MTSGQEGRARAPVMKHWSGSAPAKTNLFLHVLEREASGYHSIESLFQALELSDSLTLELKAVRATDRGPEGSDRIVVRGIPVRLRVEGVPQGELGDPRDNLVVRAVDAFLARLLADPDEAAKGRVLEITLGKSIPHGAGLGGGSSDAATALRGLNTLYGAPLLPEELLQAGATLGSDVPFFLSGSPLVLGWGRGQRLLALPPLPSRPAIIAIPGFRISTPDAYGDLAASRSGSSAPGSIPRRIDPDQLSRWDAVEALAANDFHGPIEARHPQLGRLRAGLRRAGASIALLSGSGSAVIGIFPNDETRDRALEEAYDAEPLRLIPTRTLGGVAPVSGVWSTRPDGDDG
ncbi:MAG: hypothetical protein EA351_02955 [Gemmatimonadales bacterium]|nr:MAG: hypothetical protein EA351_02955 [Gemmatimonadales bacterium]